VDSPAPSPADPPRTVGLRCRAAVVVSLGVLALVAALRIAATTAMPAWPWLLLLLVLLGPALLVELPLRLGNRRVQVAGLYEAALIICLSLHTGRGLS